MPKKKALSFSQFIKRFPTEEACFEYLYKVKWPNGFECLVCDHRYCYTVSGYRRFQCARCRHQASLTANTIMHRSHLPLHKWFWAIYLVACDKRGISALTLAGKIEVCYETAWNLLRRIRTAMQMRDERYMLSQIVEFDDAYFGAKIKGVRGRKAGNQGVFIAVSKDEKGNPAYLKMRVTDNVQIPSVAEFAEENIAHGSVVQTDGFRSYRQPLKMDTFMRRWISTRTVSI